MSYRFPQQQYQRPNRLPQQQYQSMFVPMDLGIIQQNLAQRQQRYDATSTALAQTKAGLYDMDTYDPAQKAAMIKMVEDRFGDIYSRHSGDLGAAATDVMDTIADIRSHPYFSLNKAALERQKQRDALKQQFGAGAWDFRPLPQGLAQDGQWRSQEDFVVDIEKDLGWADEVAAGWKDALKQVTREGPLKPGPYGTLQSTIYSGEGTAGQLENKLDDVLERYKSTPAYRQQMRVLIELRGVDNTVRDENGMTEADRQVRQFVKDIGEPMVAPESYRHEYRNIPDGTGTQVLGYGMVPKVVAGASAEEVAGGVIADQVKQSGVKDALQGAETELEKEQVANIISRAAKSASAVSLMEKIKKIGSDLGINPVDLMEYGYASGSSMVYTDPNDGTYDPKTDLSQGYYRGVGGELHPLKGVKVRVDGYVEPKIAARLSVFQNLLDNYNQTLEDHAKQNIDKVTGDDINSPWYAIDVQGATLSAEGYLISKEDKAAWRQVQTDADNFVNDRLSRSHFTFQTGKYVDLSPKELADDQEFKQDRFSVRIYKPTENGVKLVLNGKDNEEHVVLLNNKEVSESFSKIVMDATAERLSRTADITIDYGGNTISKGDRTYKLLDNATTWKEVSPVGAVFNTVERNGKKVTIGDLINAYDKRIDNAKTNEAKIALKREKDKFLKEQRSRHGVIPTSILPVYFFTKPEVIGYLDREGLIPETPE